MTLTAPTYVPKIGDRVRVTREGVVTEASPTWLNITTDGGNRLHWSLTGALGGEVVVEHLPDPTPPAPLFVDGDLVASTTTEGERVLRIRRAGQWFFVNGPTTGARSWLLDRELEAHVDAGSMWRVDTDQPTAVEPFAFDDEGHEVGKTYTNDHGGAWQLTPAHDWLCITPSPTLGYADEAGETLAHGWPARPLTEVTT